MIGNRWLLILGCVLCAVLPAWSQSAQDQPIVVYDHVTNNYLFYYSYDKQQIRPYKILSSEEYQRERFAETLRNGWASQRSDGSSGGLGSMGDNLVPSSLRFGVNSAAFAKIFGSNEIVINPQMSVDLTIGGKWNYADNPVIAERYRTAFSFDFNAKMQFNITGNIGDRINLNFNYNTEATFDFETNMKVDYVGSEDDIIQKIEAGNVTFPLDGSLITGSSSLFGFRTDLRFGKLDVSTVFSQQRAQSQTVELRGGGQTTLFEIQADEYDANRHFFLSQFFKSNYDKWLGNLPLILSGINIKRVEVWVTNKSGRFEETRNVVGFIDAGERDEIYNPIAEPGKGNGYPDNKSNSLFSNVDINSSNFRDFTQATAYLTGLGLKSGSDFEKLENARKLTYNDYTVNTQLGYISLNMSLNSDEVLAVAYEYEAYGVTYVVGELSTDGVVSPNTLALKLLKGTNFSPQLPTWKLMMKNVYAIDAYSLNRDEFILDVMYENAEAGTMLPYLPESRIAEKPLLRVLNLDNLNSQNDAGPDGIFDFVEGITVLASRGRVIFPVLEPFGRYLEKQINDPSIAEKYVYKELYDSTLTKAQSLAEKNKFRLVGSYKSESGDEIRLNAMNIPQGSVVVTAGGVKLVEGVDYEVNYMLGTVRILNRSYLESGIPLKVSLENQDLFNMQTKTMIGARLKYTFNENFYVGGTILHLSERPLTQKVNWGDDPISNTIWGLNTSFKTETPWLTKAIDALPFIQTKAPSNLTFEAEFAQLLPGHASAIGSSGTAFIDDFEGSQTMLDLRAQTMWSLASVPQGQPLLFPEGDLTNDLRSGFNRALLSWYYIYPDFLRNTSYTPTYMRANQDKYQKNWNVCEIYVSDLFPEREQVLGSPTTMSVLNMTYYPNERGPYNYRTTNVSPNGLFTNPQSSWAGVQRSLPVTDFETANYDYIEFWIMDPFVYHPNSQGGKLYFNLGNISEDVLRDGLKSFENGLSDPTDTTRFLTSVWGRVPKDPQITLTFDNDYQKRLYQDVGYDGVNNQYEQIHFADYVSQMEVILTDATARNKMRNDPSSDDYVYYMDPRYDQVQADILERYKYYNGTEGNSLPPELSNGENTMSTPNPDMEDVNRDYTMNETESYYQYELDLRPENMRIGSNYITDIREVTKSDFSVPSVKFYQIKIPISEGRSINGISDFKSIRFIRAFVKGFADTTVLRFATLQLVRGEWRRYDQSLIEGQEGMALPEMVNAGFDISAVNIEENSQRTPVNYVLPPGTSRQIDPGQYQTRQLNEQAMELRVMDLADGDARAAYKNITFDLRQYRRLVMDVHAEAVTGKPLKDEDVSVFIRIGTDYRYNYYEYEIPLVITPPGYYGDNQREEVWRPENKLDIDLDIFTDLKMERNDFIRQYGGTVGAVFEKLDGKNKIRMMGNPNLGGVRTIMIGIRNPSKQKNPNDDGLEKSVDVWVNELRLTNVNESSGFAANARMSVKLADFGNITLSGNMSTPNFGGLESKANQRAINYVYQYDLISNFELGMFFPKSIAVRLPVFFGFSENFTNPQYYPFDQDLKYNDAIRGMTSYERDSIKRLAQDYTRRMSFNTTNIRIFANSTKPRVFSLSNLTTSFAYNEVYARNPRTDHKIDKIYHFNLGYAYNVEPFYVEPLKKVKWLQSPWLQIIRDFNINPYPNQFSFNTDINRTYRETQYRSVTAPDVIIPATASKDFLWDGNYAFVWDLTRAIKIDFRATNRARIDEPEGIVNKKLDPDGYRHWHDSTWTNFWNLGRNVFYNQQINAQWMIPINKIPAFSWLSASAQYRAGYTWEAAPLLADNSSYDPGNTISNSRDVMINGNMSFENLYNKIPFLRNINNEFSSGGGNKRVELVDKTYESVKMRYTAKRRRTVKHNLSTTDLRTQIIGPDGQEIQGKVDVIDKNTLAVTLDSTMNGVQVKVTGRVPKKDNPMDKAGKAAIRVAMMLRNISVTYNENGATTLPGFKPEAKVMGWGKEAGSWAPGWPFVLGWQDENFMNHARNQHWLSADTSVINPYLMTHNSTWNVRATLEPWPNLRIDLTFNRTFAENNSWYNVTTNGNQRQSTGSFSMTTISFLTAFENPNTGNNFSSKAFDQFLANRNEVAQRQANNRAAAGQQNYDPTNIDPNTGFPDGFSPVSPEVLIPSFLAAYTGKSANSVNLSNFPNIPLPNWQINYNAPKINAFNGLISSLTLMSKYQSVYSINSFMLNQAYTLADVADGRNVLGDFIPQRDIQLVSIREDISPIYVDVGWRNNLSTRFEWVKNRLLSLSMSNNQVTETRSTKYVFGAGYTFDNIPLIFRFSQNKSKNVKTTLRLRADVALQDDMTILRKIVLTDDAIPQISNGQKNVSIKVSADYTVSNNVTMRLFFDRMVNKPYVSSIGTANTNAGITINFSL